MAAYQAVSNLLRLVAPHYRRADEEGRTLIQAALPSAADLAVTQRELRVTLAAQSSPHRTHAIAVLCEDLNRTKSFFPGSFLRLTYAIQEPLRGKKRTSSRALYQEFWSPQAASRKL